MRRTCWILIATLGAVLAGCTSGASNSVTGPQNNNNGSGQNGGATAPSPMTATVNGAAWSALPQVRTTYTASNAQLTITGFDAQTVLVTVSVAHITGTGTYSLNYLNVAGSSAIVATTTQGWDTFFPGGTGSVTFTTFTTHHAIGTFAFVAEPASGGASGNMPVTNGKFDVTY